MIIGLLIVFLHAFFDVFYWTKYVISLLALKIWKKNHRKRFDLYDCESEDDVEKLNILVPKEEKILETPFSEEHLQNAADDVFMYGVNSKSESLVVRVSRRPNGEAEAWLHLKLQDGRRFELTERVGYQRNSSGTSFTCGGLQMYYLSPMRRWRIIFCGMLREKEKENDTFVKFTFLWTASSDVYDASCDFDKRAAADAMANAKWTSLRPPVDKTSRALNLFCQSGVISGIVSLEDELDVEMYLFGEKIRFLGKNSDIEGGKFKHILGTIPKNGLVVHLGRASVPNTFHNLTFGFVIHPNGKLIVVEDGSVISDMTKKELTASFRAGREYDLRGNFGVLSTSERTWNGYLQLVEFEFEVDGLQGNGFMISGEVHKWQENVCQKIPKSLPRTFARPLVVCLSDEACCQTDLTGGKGSSLGSLSKLSTQMKSEFIVPKGLVVTTAAYEDFLTASIIDQIETLKDIVYGNIKGNSKEACKKVTSAIEEVQLPDKITKEIEEKLQRLFDGDVNQRKMAVRSSATGEDTDQMSAAGQMDTFLGVQGLKGIFTAVKKCWASQFGHIAVEYKRQNGQILNSPMAVVIQEMVDCEASGVLFTCDPVTDNPSVTVITANYGLGESVVSGSEEPDTIVLRKVNRTDELEIKSMTVGLKQHRIVMTDERSAEDEVTVVTEDVPDDKRRKICIPEDMAMRLGKLSLKIENYFKSPRDIEWGIKDDAIYILQSRPVTTVGATTDYEMKHEFDGPLRCEGEFYTVCNVGEVMPGATSPLGLELMNKYFPVVMKREAKRAGRRLDILQQKYYSPQFVVFYNHVTLSVINLVMRAGDPNSLRAQSMMIGLFGRLINDPDLNALGEHKKDGTVEKTPILSLLWNLIFSGRGMKQLKEATFAYECPAKAGRTAFETFELLMKSCNHIWQPFLKHIICTQMSSLWNMYMFSTLAKAKGTIDTDVYSDFAKLLATSTNVESADVPSAMQELSQYITKDIKSEEFKSMSVEEAEEWLKRTTCLAGYKFRQFIKRHGHRCLKEFDIHSIPWSMDPKPLIKLLQSMVGSCEDVKEKQEENFSQLLPHLSVPLNFKERKMLQFLLPNCRRGVREREAGKAILIKSIDNTRQGYRHLAELMVSEGYLPDSDLMFFLTLEEIRDLLHTRNSRHITRANHRRKVFPTMDSYLFPEIFKGSAVPMNENQDEMKYVADLTLKGIPVSQGSTKGFARVALTLEEAAHLKPGEILITYSTDVGWSPYFPILAGVVTELGGLISHGAVVSREYGLPCVVGLHGATKQFVTGDYVFLDGSKGILQRIAAPELDTSSDNFQ